MSLANTIDIKPPAWRELDNSETALVPSSAPDLQPAPLFTPTPKAAKRVLEFFTAQINNDHTRKAYLNATRRFAEWCDGCGIGQLAGVQPVHVAAFVNMLIHFTQVSAITGTDQYSGPQYIVAT